MSTAVIVFAKAPVPGLAKTLLVSSLASFSDYQRERAWTWEHQALVRARCVSGDASLCKDFERVRTQTLARERDPARVLADVSSMRRRMRAELDRTDAAMFDLKQGAGGLVDLEFLLQALVLREAAPDGAETVTFPPIVARTMITGAVLGRMCRKTMRAALLPCACNASMKGLTATRRVSLYTTRQKSGQ